MQTETHGSVSILIGVITSPVGSGSTDAAMIELWSRVSDRLVALARSKMKSRVGSADEEDLALGAYYDFCREARAGKFEWVDSRDALWRLFMRITARKVARLYRYEGQKVRDHRRTINETDFTRADSDGADSQCTGGPLANAAANTLDPVEVLMVDDSLRGLLAALDDKTLVAVALRRLEGWTNKEIAAELKVCEKTIDRKMAIIRKTWIERDLDADGVEGDTTEEFDGTGL